MPTIFKILEITSISITFNLLLKTGGKVLSKSISKKISLIIAGSMLFFTGIAVLILIKKQINREIDIAHHNIEEVI